MRLTSSTKATSMRSKQLPRNGCLDRLILWQAGITLRCGAVVEDEFYNKLERLNVQAGEKDKILAAHVQRICEAHDTVMRSYYQQMHSNAIVIDDFFIT